MTVAVVLFPSFQRHRSRLVVLGPQFGNLTMQMDHILSTCPLMQIIDILGDDACLGQRLLQLGNRHMRSIRLSRQSVFSAGVVKIHAQLRVAQPCLVGTHIFDAVMFP